MLLKIPRKRHEKQYLVENFQYSLFFGVINKYFWGQRKKEVSFKKVITDKNQTYTPDFR